MLHGFFNIDKPAGITSHDVVAQVRRLARQRRVGHAGTLDPSATGVLVVALGAATRLIEYVQDQTIKEYRAVVRLGSATTTDDAEGEPLETRPVPALDRTALEALLAQFHGMIEQVPPMYSALHHEGQRLHELARAGKTVELAPRPVYIERITFQEWSTPDLTIEVRCGKGTYIRALARDMGAALGCGAHLYALRRTAVGTFRIEDAVGLDTMAQWQDDTMQNSHDNVIMSSSHRVTLSHILLPPEIAVADWPAVTLDEAATRRVRNGQTIVLDVVADDRVRAHGPDGALLALLRRDGPAWKPEKVFDWTI
jgi:tRNA pseudouridine55 synthase